MIDHARPFKHPSTTPAKRGLYVRDWRGTSILPESDCRLSIDLWEPVRDPKDILYPGVWYVWPNWNDANEQRLPWRAVTKAERAAFLREHPNALP
jgi:hypothetical protein